MRIFRSSSLLMNFVRCFNLETLIRLSNQKLLLPLYHTVSDGYLPHINNLYQVKTINNFRKDLDYICRYYKSISVEDMLVYKLNSNLIEKPYFHLSFDDGLKEIRTIIAPILLEKGIHATFFINSDFIDNKTLFYRFKASLIIDKLKSGINENSKQVICKLLNCNLKSLKSKILKLTWNDIYILDKIASLINLNFTQYLKNEPYLNTEDIEWLRMKGFSLGAHSKNHPNYLDISLDEQINQTNYSLNYMINNYNIAHNLFAFPFSNKGVGKSYFNHPDLIPNTSFGTNGLEMNKLDFIYQRVPLEFNNYNADNIIKANYVKYLIKRLF